MVQAPLLPIEPSKQYVLECEVLAADNAPRRIEIMAKQAENRLLQPLQPAMTFTLR
jgi:hypothetical protein